MPDKEKQIKKLAGQAERFATHPNLPVVDVLEQIGENLARIAEKETPEKDVQKVELMGAEIITIQGKQGEKI